MDGDLSTLRERLRLRWSLATESFAAAAAATDSLYMDANALRARLLTFTTDLWPRRPLDCDAVRAAHFGWFCHGKDALRCHECSAILIQPYNVLTSEDPDTLLAAVAHYAQQLVDSHQSGCVWRLFHCPDDLLDSFKMLSEYKDALCSFGCGGTEDRACEHRYWCVFYKE